MILRGKSIIILLLAGLAAASAREPEFHEFRAVQESLREIEPWFRRRWLSERGLQDYYKQMSWKPDSQGIRCIGRWSYGPSVKVSLRVTPDDTIVCLARGSGASLIRFRSRDSLELQFLSDINCYGIVKRAIIRDTLVFCGMSQGGTGIEIHGVTDLGAPHLLSYVHLPPIMDIAVQDTFLYAIGYQQDSLRIFNVADPRNPVQVGACADSGFPMCIAGDNCYLSGQHGLNIINVSDPENPSRAGRIGGFEVLSVVVRDTLCFFGTATNGLRVYNVRNPASPIPIGSLGGIQPPDIYLPPTCDTVLYTPKFDIINITDPGNPRLIGHVEAPGWDYGVRAVPALNYALVADYFEGLVAIDITSPSTPRIDTMLYAADMVQDIHIDNDKAYLASHHAGLQILDVSSPELPSFSGSYDTVGTRPSMNAAIARDSFAYVGWPRPRLLSIDVSEPTQPIRAGGCEGMFGYPEDMVLRDSFVFIAENRRFQVVNVARPREPELVGSCELPDDAAGMCLRDTLAYVAYWPISIINVTDPENPRIVSSIWRGATNVFVKETLAYVAGGRGLFTYSVADPRNPYEIDSTGFGSYVFDVVIVDTLAYVGCRDMLRLLSVADPRNPRVIGYHSLPNYAWRLTCDVPYVYAACAGAGICIFETTQVGISEESVIPERSRSRFIAIPNPTAGRVRLVAGNSDWTQLNITVRDVLGCEVKRVRPTDRNGRTVELSLADLPAGLYFLELVSSKQTKVVEVVKVIKQ